MLGSGKLRSPTKALVAAFWVTLLLLCGPLIRPAFSQPNSQILDQTSFQKLTAISVGSPYLCLKESDPGVAGKVKQIAPGKFRFTPIANKALELKKINQGIKNFKAQLKRKLTSKLKKKAQVGLYKLQMDRIAIERCTSSRNRNFPVMPASMSKSYDCPDLNEDGASDSLDAKFFLQMPSTDFNKDGKQDAKDVIDLLSAIMLNNLEQNLCDNSNTPSPLPIVPLPPSETPAATPTSSPGTNTPSCELPWALLPSGPCSAENNCSVETASATSGALLEVGPFNTYPTDGIINGMSFYVVSQGSGELVSLGLTRSQFWNKHRAVLRVVDPDGRVVYWKMQTQEPNGSGQPVQPIIQTVSPTEPPPPNVFALKKSGVYEIRLSTNSNSILSLKLSPGTMWGFSTQNGNLRESNWGNHNGKLYAWVPSHPTVVNKMTIIGAHTGLKIYRDNGNVLMSNSQLTIAPGQSSGGEIWRFDLPAGNVHYFKVANGVPIVFSTTKEAALAIKASSNVIPDGPLAGYRVAHRYQLELAKLIPDVLAEIKQGEFSFANVSLSSMQQPACKDPAQDDDVYRFANLLGYGYNSGTVTSAAWGLKSSNSGSPNQQIDPTKPWLGSFGIDRLGRQACTSSSSCLNGSSCIDGFCSVPFNPNVDRWDVERALFYEDLGTDDPDDTIGLRGGISPNNSVEYGFAFSAITETPCNPFRPSLIGESKQRSLIARATLSLILDLMKIAESELIIDDGSDADPYGTINLFPLTQVVTPKYRMVSKAISSAFPEQKCGGTLSEIINAAIGIGMRGVIDRQLGDYQMSNGNQHAHAILAFRQFADGFSSEPSASLYESISDKTFEDFAAKQSPAGYWTEGYGPDASYIGMTHDMIGHYYRLAEAAERATVPLARAAINASYALFLHTVAPEKSGQLLGSFNANHRIATDFVREQWGGAKGIADNIEYPGLMGQVAFNDIASARVGLKEKVNQFATHATVSGAMTSGGTPEYFLYLNHSQRDQTAKFPYQEQNFSREFGDEFIFVKKQAYMASVYIGKPAGSVNSTTREAIRNPNPAIEDVDPNTDPDNDASVSAYQNTPQTGGGLSMFWTPEFGNSLIGGSWSPLVHNGLVGVIGGKRYWEKYEDTSATWLPSSNLLISSGTLENTSIEYSRAHSFADDKVQINLSLTYNNSFPGTSFVENIPFLTCTRSQCASTSGVTNRKTFGSTITDLGGNPLSGSVTVSGFKVVDSQGDGVKVLFDMPRPIQVYPHGMREVYYGSELQIGRVQIPLPTNLDGGATYQIQYSIAPL